MTKNKRNEEEQFIFRRMVEGDKEAFRFFFEKYYTELCNLVNLYIHNEIIAEEIVQDIYIYLWEKKGNIHIESSISPRLRNAISLYNDNRCLSLLKQTRGMRIQTLCIIGATKPSN